MSRAALVRATLMAALLVAIALLAIVTATSAMDVTKDDLVSEESMRALYERWCARYKVTRELGEKTRRFDVFKENARVIHEFNQGNASYKLSLNLFGDMTEDETRSAYTCSSGVTPPGRTLNGTTELHGGFTNVTARDLLPAEVDWSKRGFGGRPMYVTNSKDQGNCGACWAFASTSAVESINAIRTRRLTPLSVQQVLDCDRNSYGCYGGFVISALQYIAKSGGVVHEGAYPYKGWKGPCTQVRSPVVTIDGYGRVPPYDAFALMKAVAAQPVVVAVQADELPFKRYGGGVFRGPCGTRLGHVVTLVGYGTTKSGEKYWIAKNSWGRGWGENGYIRMARDVPGREGLCGILMDASYPVKRM